MKIHFWSIALVYCALLPAAATPLRAQLSPEPSGEANPYELVTRTLLPIASVFSPQTTQHALSLSATLQLQAMTGLPPEMVGARIDLAVQPPDRFLIRCPYMGQTVTVCRVGQNVWISPGSKLASVLAQFPSSPIRARKLSKGGEAALAPIVIPLRPQEMALLPVLCDVKDAGRANGMQLLDVHLVAEMARKLGIEEWAARLFITPGNGGEDQASPKLAGIEIARPGWHLAARVVKLQYGAKLPESQWEPPTQEPPGTASSPDVVRLTGPQIRHWADAIASQINANVNTTP